MAKPPKPPGPGRGRRKGSGFGSLGDGVARLRVLSLRLSDAELEAIRTAAAAAGMPPSAWVVQELRRVGVIEAR